MAELPPPKRVKVVSTSRYYCPHCSSNVAKSTFFDHKQRFYDSVSNSWSQRSMDGCDDELVPMVDMNTGMQTEDTDVHQASTCQAHSTSSSPITGKEQQHSSPLREISVDQSCLEDEDLQYFEGDVEPSDSKETEDCFEIEIQDDEDVSENPSTGIHPVVRLVLLFILMWQFSFHVSDSGVVALLLFMHHFLRLLSRVTGANVLAEIAGNLPKTITTASKILGFNVDSFTRYVVCPTCHAVYDFDDCYTVSPDKEKVAKNCRFIAYPNHPHQLRRQPCGTPLLKRVRRKGQKVDLQPFKEYCFQSLECSLKRLLQLPSFLEHLERANEFPPDDLMCDV